MFSQTPYDKFPVVVLTLNGSAQRCLNPDLLLWRHRNRCKNWGKNEGKKGKGKKGMKGKNVKGKKGKNEGT